jgi:HD superfamily phosphohydrolase
MRLLPRKVLPSKALIDEVKEGTLQEQHRELEILRQELSTLRPLQENQINGLAKLLIKVWLAPGNKKQEKLFFDDPVWGHTCIDEELSDLFFHPLIQRLNHIKQLSFAYLRFPNATHTRLAHSLGTCRNLEVSLTTIFRNNVLYSATAARSIRLDPISRRNLIIKAKTAALLHDVGHAPFGHALDKLIGYLNPAHSLRHPDKHYSRLYIEKFLAPSLPTAVDKGNLDQILREDRIGLSGWDTLVADLIDSALDADRMDFLVRDAHMTGLSMGVTGIEALIERMCPYEEDDQIYLTFDSSCIPYVEDFLVAREKMYALCYEHPSKLAAERIFTRLVQSLLEKHNLGPDLVMLLTDEQILALLGLAAVGSEETSKLLYALLQHVDYTLLHEVSLKDGNGEVAQWTSARDSSRLGRWAYVEKPGDWEKAITAAAGLGEGNSWQVLVSVPDQRTGVPNEVAARLLERIPSGYRVRSLLEVEPKLLDRLKEAHTPRSKIRVFADSRLSESQKKEVERAAKELLGDPQPAQ